MILLIGFVGVLVVYVMMGIVHLHGHILDIEHFLGMHKEENYWKGGQDEQEVQGTNRHS